MVYRLVGFLEYANALRNFDELVKMSTPQELKAIDELVKELDEFAIYTNLSRRLQRGPSSLTEKAANGDDQFQRRGLAWVMALARVELGGMLAGFTPVQQPFEAVRPTSFEMPQYRELLLDGVRSHYWALRNDPQLRRVARSSVGAASVAMLSYSRRLVLARAMWRAAAKAGGGLYNPVQKQELLTWKSFLDGIQTGFVAKINDYLQTQQRSKTRFSSRQDNRWCTALLRAEKRELAAGTATISTFGK